MKKILLLLLFTAASYGQAVFDEGIQIKNNTTDNSATKVNVQDANGVINTIPKADLINVIEVASVPALPLIGEAGKIYVVKDLNKIYRWNGTVYQELAINLVTSVSGKVGAVTLVKADVGLSNVDNTTDLLKPISTATQTALNGKEPSFSKNTAFNKNFGTTSGTVVEGGTLGSNAYNSIAYLPLSGGTLTGILNVNKLALQIVSEGSDQGAIDLLRTGDTRFRVFSDINGFGIYNFQSGVSNLLLNKTTGAATFSSTVTATSFNGSATLTGTPTAPTAPAGTNTTQLATTAFVLANGGRPYKVYTALLSQTGTNAPVATVLENTLGGTVVWSRDSAGFYRGTLTGAFVNNKTTINISSGIVTSFYSRTCVVVSSNEVYIYVYQGDVGTDNLMGNSYTSVEIRVYL